MAVAEATPMAPTIAILVPTALVKAAAAAMATAAAMAMDRTIVVTHAATTKEKLTTLKERHVMTGR